jgi:hypothetical protein
VENLFVLAHAERSKHDFAIYQDSIGGFVSEKILFLGNSSEYREF